MREREKSQYLITVAMCVRVVLVAMPVVAMPVRGMRVATTC